MAIAIMATLVDILLPAIQRARAAGMRVQCANNVHQIGIAIHQYQDSCQFRHPGSAATGPVILPYVERQKLWEDAEAAYQLDPVPFHAPPHNDYCCVLSTYACPADPRTLQAQATYNHAEVALTSYVGVNGTTFLKTDGVFFRDSRIRLTDITDGTSTTLMVGERPPSTDYWYGWWYAGVAQEGTGSPDMLLGVRELNANASYLWLCDPGPYRFVPGTTQNECDVMHFWSTHFGGAHLLFCDGSVRFLGYDADSVLPALATRNGGEATRLP